MPWFQVDDQLPVHRKVTAAGNAAMGLWVRAGSWCQANLTGGFVPNDIVRSLGTVGQAKALVKAGLWHTAEGGYQFHDWDLHQMSVEELLERKRKRQEAGRKGGQASGESRRGEASASPNTSALANQKPNEKRTPGPGPVLSGVTYGGGVTEGDDPEPPRYCPKHPNDTDKVCRPCIARRKAHDAWKDRQKAREADELESRRQQKNQAAQLLKACRACDEDGWRYDDRAIKCDHQEAVNA